MKKHLFLSLTSITVYILLVVLFLAPVNTTIDQKIFDSATRASIPFDFGQDDLIDRLAAKGNYRDLPVGEVSFHEAQDAEKAAVLIPQNHRYPGSSPKESVNDSAEKAQKQIYDIIDALNSRYGLDFIMVEGEIYGHVPEEKISSTEEKLDLRNRFDGQLARIENELKDGHIDRQTEAAFFRKADRVISGLDREIILSGAPYKLKAEGKDLTLYGAENRETREKCARIVRKYIYQKDQLNKCAGPAGSNPGGLAKAPDISGLKQKLRQLSGEEAAAGQTIADKLSGLKSLLEKDEFSILFDFKDLLEKAKTAFYFTDDNVSLEREFARLKASARRQGENDLLGMLQEAEHTYQDITFMREKKAGKGSANKLASASGLDRLSSTTPPSRADNPYSHITDREKLKGMLEETSQEMQEYVIDRRDHETAVNFARALSKHGEEAGILQFGAGHEEGLVDELKKAGLSVIVLKPEEVLRRELEGGRSALRPLN